MVYIFFFYQTYCMGVFPDSGEQLVLGMTWLLNRKVGFDLNAGTVTIQDYHPCKYYPKTARFSMK